MSVSLVRDLCFVDSESNCLCAREDGRAREEWSVWSVIRSVHSVRSCPLPGKFSHFSGIRTTPKFLIFSLPCRCPLLSFRPSLPLCQSSEIIFMKVRRWHERRGRTGGRNRKTILLFSFLFLRMEVTAEQGEHGGEVRHVRKSRGEERGERGQATDGVRVSGGRAPASQPKARPDKR